MGAKKRRRVEHTEDWGQLELLLDWPEQVEYEKIRPVVVFGDSVLERVRETSTSERTLHRRVESFDAHGMQGLLPPDPLELFRGRRLSLAMRLRIVELKAEHPPLSLGEIARSCYALFGKEPSKHTVKRIIEEGPTPLLPPRRYTTYHQMPPGKERRKAIVALHVEGWTAKAIAGYLDTSQPTVYQTLKRWASEGEAGLEDRPRGRPASVRKVDLRTHETVRKLQQNPGLGAFRMQAALEQLGILGLQRFDGHFFALGHPRLLGDGQLVISRAHVADRGVPTIRIVEAFYIVEDGTPRRCRWRAGTDSCTCHRGPARP
jgi:hypothetical protein